MTEFAIATTRVFRHGLMLRPARPATGADPLQSLTEERKLPVFRNPNSKLQRGTSADGSHATVKENGTN